nr:hypothetical protein [Campylobacter concisus]
MTTAKFTKNAEEFAKNNQNFSVVLIMATGYLS